MVPYWLNGKSCCSQMGYLLTEMVKSSHPKWKNLFSPALPLKTVDMIHLRGSKNRSGYQSFSQLKERVENLYWFMQLGPWNQQHQQGNFSVYQRKSDYITFTLFCNYSGLEFGWWNSLPWKRLYYPISHEQLEMSEINSFFHHLQPYKCYYHQLWEMFVHSWFLHISTCPVPHKAF